MRPRRSLTAISTRTARLTDPSWRYTDLALGHELYCAGHLLQAAVAHARAGDGDELLPVARRFADELDATFGPGRREGLDGHAEVEPALVELYRVTGERRYLELASVLVERRGHGHLNANPRGAVYSQDHEPVRASTSLAGHAVRALYLMSGVTDVAVETHDTELLDVAVRLWDDTAATKRYLTGGARDTRTSRSARRTSCRPTRRTARPTPRSRA